MYIGTRIEYIHTHTLLRFRHAHKLGHIYCNDWTLVQFLTGGLRGLVKKKIRICIVVGVGREKRNKLHHSGALIHTSKVQTLHLELRCLF